MSYSQNENYKNLIDAMKDKKYDNLKQEITIFINEFIDDCKLIDTIYNSIIENIIQPSYGEHIKIIIKTHFMDKLMRNSLKNIEILLLKQSKRKSST